MSFNEIILIKLASKNNFKVIKFLNENYPDILDISRFIIVNNYKWDESLTIANCKQCSFSSLWTHLNSYILLSSIQLINPSNLLFNNSGLDLHSITHSYFAFFDMNLLNLSYARSKLSFV